MPTKLKLISCSPFESSVGEGENVVGTQKKKEFSIYIWGFMKRRRINDRFPKSSEPAQESFLDEQKGSNLLGENLQTFIAGIPMERASKGRR